jgi:Rieske Fe-S protein
MAQNALDQEIAGKTTAGPAGVEEAGCGAEGACGCGTDRRALLRAAGIAGAVAAVAVTAAACGGSSSPASTNAQPAASDTGAASTSASASSSGGSGSGGSSALTTTAQVPVQGGVILANDDDGIVITQPESGTFKAFSSTCTHMGCTVGTVADNKIMCPCHGSVYSATDGSVLGGPAPKSLPAKSITVSNGQIFAA